MKDIHTNSKVFIDGLRRKRARNRLIAILLSLGLLGGGGGKLIQLGSQFKHIESQIEERKYDQALDGLQRFSKWSFWGLTVTGKDVRVLYLKISTYLLQEREFQKSLEVLDIAIQKFPDVPEFYLNKATVFVHLKRFEEAKKALEMALGMPGIEASEKMHGMAYYLILAQVYLANREMDQAKVYIDKAKSIAPENADIELMYARYYALQNKLSEMLPYYQKAMKGKALSLQWTDYFMVAVTYLQNSDIKNFNLTFAQARQLFSNAPGFHLLQSLKFIQQENYATAYYQILFERETNLIGYEYFEEGIRGIEAEFEKAFKRKPQESWLESVYYFIQGKRVYEKGDLKQAQKWMEKSLKGKQIHPLQHLYYARVLKGQNRESEATGYYGMVLEKLPNLSLASAELAEMYLSKGELNPAQNLWKHALKIDSSVTKYIDLTDRLIRAGVQGLASIPTPPLINLDRTMQLQMNQILIQQVGQMLSAV